MSKKCPNIVQIDKATHKTLKIMSANENKSMGRIVAEMVKIRELIISSATMGISRGEMVKAINKTKHSLRNDIKEKFNIGEGVIENDEI